MYQFTAARLLTKRRVGVVVVVLLLAATFFFAPFWLSLPARFLTVNDSLERADVIVVLSGAVIWRAQKGVALFKAGYADKILLTGGYANDYFLHLMGERMTEAEMTGRLVARLGVPPSAIVIIKGGTGTWEEAEYIRQYVRDDHVRKVILVTSHSHSRRARWVFRKVLHPEGVKVMVVEADHGRYTPADWWRTESGLVTVFSEYVKWVYYLANYSFREPSAVKPLEHPVPAE